MDAATLKAKQEKTKLVLSNIYNLPALSGAMLEITRMLDNPNTNSQVLGKIISKDQGIATKILSIANSPLYGLRRKVSTIDFAILVIGFTEIKNIILALSLMESFRNKTDKNLDQKEFWLHSFLSGTASKRIAEELKYDNPGKAFIVGLLHDLGIPVIHKYFHTNFLEIIESVKETGQDHLEAETEALGYNHQEIGSFLSDKWNLPEAICNAIKYHHTPLKDEMDPKLTGIIHLADYMTQKLKTASFYWDAGMSFSDEEASLLGFENMEQVDRFTEGFKIIFEEEAKTSIF
ncbi:MAG: HDOD domain-containing protein [Chlorobi bacterium]|nr:HDOD domain-containing protein [Chlorobiota bacterium]